MLGLCSHEKHFSLLREEVKFGKKNNKVQPVDQQRFFLLHLSLMRDYLELEFQPVKDGLKFPFDIEKVSFKFFTQSIYIYFYSSLITYYFSLDYRRLGFDGIFSWK
jgi:5'-3' exoribonuclease 1